MVLRQVQRCPSHYYLVEWQDSTSLTDQRVVDRGSVLPSRHRRHTVMNLMTELLLEQSLNVAEHYQAARTPAQDWRLL